MNKVLLIIQREYLTRVRKKSFIIMIFVVPLLILGMSGLIALVAKNTSELSSEQVVNVIDNSHVFADKFHNVKNIKFQPANKSLTDAKAGLQDNEDLSVLLIPANYTKVPVQIFSKKKPSIK